METIAFLQEVGAPCEPGTWTLAYPYGETNDAVTAVVRSKGCAIAMTTEVATADLTQHDPLRLPRYDTNDFPKNE